MGWNSWNHFGCDIDEQVVRESADALVALGLADLGYVYLNVDDCWAAPARDARGRLVARADTFPSGVKALADYAHARGLKLGIYSDAGFLTCAGQPGSLGFEDVDAATFAAWEVDYLKYDNCFTDGSAPQPRYRAMQRALNRTGRPILYSICEWGTSQPATWAAPVGNAWRTTGDIEPRWPSVLRNADANDAWAGFAGPGGWNDPDMLEVGNGNLTLDECRAHMSLWALAKAPLLVGADLRRVGAEYVDVLRNREVVAVSQDPAGVQGRKVRVSGGGGEGGEEGRQEVWAGPLARGRMAVVLLNRGERAVEVAVQWREQSLRGVVDQACAGGAGGGAGGGGAGEKEGGWVVGVAGVRDLWEHEDLVVEEVSGGVKAVVPAHGVKMYTVALFCNRAGAGGGGGLGIKQMQMRGGKGRDAQTLSKTHRQGSRSSLHFQQ